MPYIYNLNLDGTTYLLEPLLYISPTLSGSTYTATLTDFTLVPGASIHVKFTTTNPVDATLNVNGTGAKNIFYNDMRATAGLFKPNHVYTLVYDGIQWQLTGDIDTNTQEAYGNITTSGTLTAANQAVITDANKKITSKDMTTVATDISAEATAATTFIYSLTQDSQGKLTAKTRPLALASTSASGIVRVGNGITVDNGVISVTAANLGLNNAMHFIGIATRTISDDDTGDPGIQGYTTRQAGDVIIDQYTRREYVWTTANKWELLGFDTSQIYSVTTDNNSNTFISSISQATDGTVTASTKNLITSGRWAGVSGSTERLTSNTSTTASDPGGLTWFNIDGTAGHAVNTNDTPTAGWWYILRNRHTNTSNNYYTDIAIPFNSASLYYKIVRNGSVVNDEWTKILDARNYTDYTVTKTGSGASGTWAINITGSAANLTCLGRRTTAAQIKLNPSVDTGYKLTWHLSDATSRSNDATNSPSFDAAVLNLPWDWGAYIGQIALENTVKGDTRMQIRSAANKDNGTSANPRYTPDYGAWREVVTAPKATAVGNANQPVYVNATGQITIANSYGGGTAVTLNGASKASSTASFYAPTSGGTAGQVLISQGTAAPVWTAYAQMIDGCLNLYPLNSNYREGIRIHPAGSWSDITLMGNTNTSTSGIAATDWFIGNNAGIFYITHAGSSSSSTGYIRASTRNSAGYWELYQRVGINGVSDTYNLYVNGTSYFNGLTTLTGPLRIGTTDAAENTGYATANVGANNYIAFYGVYNDAPGSYTHTFIGESIYGSKTTANEQSELLLFHGNDPAAGSGPDRIRLFAGEVEIQTYTSALSGSWDTIRATTGTRIANFKNGEVRVNGSVYLDNINGSIYKYYGSASTVPFLQLNSNNFDTSVLKIDGNNPSAPRDSQSYGFNLKYMGTGSGAGNTLRLYGDNSDGTDQLAMEWSGDGKVGIGTTYSGSYRLNVSGASHFNGSTVMTSSLHIYGPTIGNDAASMISKTAGLFSWGDTGPKITFDTVATPGNAQAGAIIFTDHDSAGTGVSWHFVTNQGDNNVISRRFHAKTSISIGTNLPVTSHNLYINGSTYFNSTSIDNTQGRLSFVQNSTIVGNNVDFNTLTTPGCYKIQMASWGAAATYHGPNEAQSNLYSFGLLFVFRGSINDGENRVEQIYFPHNTSADHPIYSRMLNSTSWQAWHRITRGSPTYTGGGASGTWGISISGNAAAASTCSGNAATATALTSSAGDQYSPVYFSSGKPVLAYPVQYSTWSITASGHKKCVLTKAGCFTTDTYVLALVVTSGEAYLNGPLTWTSATDTLTISTAVAVTGAVSGYVITARGMATSANAASST